MSFQSMGPKIRILFLIFCGACVCNCHLSEDKRDDGVELIREKRDNFIDRILKSIPFFHMAPPQNVLEEEQIDQDQLDDDDDDDDNDDDNDSTSSSSTTHILIQPSTSVGVSTIASHLSLGVSKTTTNQTPTVLSATTLHYTPTIHPSQSSYISVSMSIDSMTTTFTSVKSSLTISATRTIDASPLQTHTTQMMSRLDGIDHFFTTNRPQQHGPVPAANPAANPYLATASASLMNASSLTYPLSSSGVSASVAMPSTVSMVTATPLASKDDPEPVIKMMIMSGESPLRVQEYAGGRLADERAFGESLAKQQVGEDIDVKNIRFMYASVLVPVMSGLVGALLITFGILIFKCIKRKKLKRVRYYGAKPGSGLYRLDQIGLLSDMSSDED